MRFGFAFGLCQISGFIDYFTILACWGFQLLCNGDCGVVKFGDIFTGFSMQYEFRDSL